MLILWKDGVFCADRREVSSDGVILPERQRLFVLDNSAGVLAHTGDQDTVDVLLAASAYSSADGLSIPTIAERPHKALLLVEDRMTFISEGMCHIIDPNAPLAYGPCSEIALGAMLAGLSASEAMRVWQNHTVWGGGQTETCRYNETEDTYTYHLG